MPLTEKWILKCCEETRKELEEKNEELQKARDELEKIEAIKAKRKPTVIKGFKRILANHKKDRKPCKECPPNKVQCKRCLDHFDHFIRVIVDGGFLEKMREKLIELEISKVKTIVTDIMTSDVGYCPQW